MKSRVALSTSIAILTSLSPGRVLAAEDVCLKPKPVVFFMSGMFNTMKTARRSAAELGKFFVRHRLHHDFDNSTNVRLAYNQSELPWQQLEEVIEQKASAAMTHFFANATHLSHAPEVFQKLFAQVHRDQTMNTARADTDLQKQVDEVAAVLKERPVLLVAHSQGNFYANSVYEFLRVRMDVARKLAVQAVATPAGYVAGDGKWTTLKNDLVILPVPGSLKANALNSQTGLVNHEFVDSYLSGDDSGSKIKEQIRELAKTLDLPKRNLNTYVPEVGHYAEDAQSVWYWTTERLKLKAPLALPECLVVRALAETRKPSEVACSARTREAIKTSILNCRKHMQTPLLAPNGKNSCPFTGMDSDRIYTASFPSLIGRSECMEAPYKFGGRDVDHIIDPSLEFDKVLSESILQEAVRLIDSISQDFRPETTL